MPGIAQGQAPQEPTVRLQRQSMSSIAPIDKVLLSYEESAAMLSISVTSLRALITYHVLPVVRIGSRTLLHRETVQTYADAALVKAKDEAVFFRAHGRRPVSDRETSSSTPS